MSEYQFSIQYTTENPSKPMQFKAAANYAAQIVRNPANYVFTALGVKFDASITIWLGNYAVAQMDIFGKVSYDEVIIGGDEYPAVMYILQAIKNAREEVRAIYNQEMTPTEVESELNLNFGVVRKYIHDNRENLLADRHIRYADRRTVLIKRGVALSRWGHSGERRWQDSSACGLLVNGQITEKVWGKIVGLDFGNAPAIETKHGRYFRTRTIVTGQFSGYVERVESPTDDAFYRVYSIEDGAYYRDADLEIRQVDDQYRVYSVSPPIWAIKLRILQVLGVTA